MASLDEVRALLERRLNAEPTSAQVQSLQAAIDQGELNGEFIAGVVDRWLASERLLATPEWREQVEEGLGRTLTPEEEVRFWQGGSFPASRAVGEIKAGDERFNTEVVGAGAAEVEDETPATDEQADAEDSDGSGDIVAPNVPTAEQAEDVASEVLGAVIGEDEPGDGAFPSSPSQFAAMLFTALDAETSAEIQNKMRALLRRKASDVLSLQRNLVAAGYLSASSVKAAGWVDVATANAYAQLLIDSKQRGLETTSVLRRLILRRGAATEERLGELKQERRSEIAHQRRLRERYERVWGEPMPDTYFEDNPDTRSLNAAQFEQLQRNDQAWQNSAASLEEQAEMREELLTLFSQRRGSSKVKPGTLRIVGG